jgi:mono/diheme cytochrome c family protein
MQIVRSFRDGLAVAALAVSGAAAQEPPAHPGEAVYRQYCGACHGIGADGKGPLATILEPKPADLRAIAARRDGVFPDAEIVRIVDGRDPIVAHGTRDMPVWGERLRDEVGLGPTTEARTRGTLNLIVQYLKSVQR